MPDLRTELLGHELLWEIRMKGKLGTGAKVLAFTMLLVVFLAACGGGSSSSASVNVTEKEWSISPDLTQVKAGKITFNVSNAGTEPHEFLIFQSDLPIDGLPVSNGEVNEDSLNKVEDSDPIAVGVTDKVSVKLAAGKYVFVCNITENPPGQPSINHYQKGMRTAFTVN